MTLTKILKLWPPFSDSTDEETPAATPGIIGIMAYNADGASSTVSSGTATGSGLVGILTNRP